MKKVLVVCLALCLISSAAFAGQWVFKEASVVGWNVATDQGEDGINLHGFKNPYGVAVDPDGNIWCSAYYQRYWFDTDGTTKIWPDDMTIQVTADSSYVIGTYPIFIKKTDGTFVTLQFLQLGGGEQDTLKGSGCRGMNTDHEGNIIYISNNKIAYKINYQTYEVIAKYEFDFSPARPGVDENGYVFIPPLLGGTVHILEPDDWSAPYNLIPDVVTSVTRCMDVSPDGKSVYLAAYNGGVQHYYSEDGVDGTYAIADTIFKNHNGTQIEANIVIMDPSGLLWIGTREEAALNLFWALDPANDYAIVDSTSFTWWANTDKSDTTTGGYPQAKYLRAPRDAAFSPDGLTMYIADMYSYVIKAYEYSPTDVDFSGGSQVPVNFNLYQNYPNPFNPTTTIPYALQKDGIVELKVYDTMGREVKTLASGPMTAGNHKVDFNGKGLASGVYVYRLTVDGQLQTKQMILVK